MIDTARLHMSASGRIDLAAETLALRLRPTPRAAHPATAVPVRLTGGFSDLKVEPDTVTAGQTAVPDLCANAHAP
jgi:hypothetical protein